MLVHLTKLFCYYKVKQRKGHYNEFCNSDSTQIWCARQELNLHPDGPGPNPGSSASSVTGAYMVGLRGVEPLGVFSISSSDLISKLCTVTNPTYSRIIHQ